MKIPWKINPTENALYCLVTGDSNSIHDFRQHKEKTIVPGRLLESIGLEAYDFDSEPMHIRTELSSIVRVNDYVSYTYEKDGFVVDNNEKKKLNTRFVDNNPMKAKIQDVSILEYNTKDFHKVALLGSYIGSNVPITFLLGKSSHAIILYGQHDKIMNDLPESQVYMYGSIDTILMPSAFNVKQEGILHWKVKRISEDKIKFTPEILVEAYHNNTPIYKTRTRLSRIKKKQLF